MNLCSGAEGHLFGWSHGQKICQHPLLPFKTLLSKLGPLVPFIGSGRGSENTPSKEHQEQGVTDVSSWEGI